MSIAPEGTYRAKLAEMQFGQSANKGTPQIDLIVDVTISTNDIRRKTISMYMSEKAAPYTEEKLALLGFNGDFDHPWCETTEFDVYVKHEPWANAEKGTSGIGEKWNVSSAGSRAKPADDGVKAQMSQRWRAQYGSKPVARPSAPPPVTPASTPPTPPLSAPPKGPPPEVAPAADVWDKNRAWAEWEAEFGDKLDVSKWTQVLQQVMGTRTERQLTSKDWQDVAKAAGIPF